MISNTLGVKYIFDEQIMRTPYNTKLRTDLKNMLSNGFE